MTLNTAAHDRHIISPNPVVFLYSVASKMDCDFTFGYHQNFYRRYSPTQGAGASNFLGVWFNRSPDKNEAHPTIRIYYYMPGEILHEQPSKKLLRNFSKYLREKPYIGTFIDPPFQNFPEMVFSGLDEFEPYLNFSISYESDSRYSVKTRDTGSLYIHIGQHKPYAYTIEKNIEYMLSGEDFLDIGIPHPLLMGIDYRPFVHRMVEMLASVPKEQWHNPAIYTQTTEQTAGQSTVQSAYSLTAQLMENTNAACYDTDIILANLFSGDELVRMQKLIKKTSLTARNLTVRNGLLSIPKLCLGVKILAKNGNSKSDISAQDVINGSAYLIELLSLSADAEIRTIDAENRITRALMNYIFNNTDVQTNVHSAEMIVNQLHSLKRGV